MEKIVVDTDIIIDYLGGARTAAAFLESIDPQFRSTTTVNCMEVLQGARNSTEIRKLGTFLSATFEILPLTPKSCATALDLIRRHALPSGLRTGDALIAAEAIAAASQFPGQVASLIVPMDCQMGTAKETAYPRSPELPACTSDATIARIADALRMRKPAALLLGAPGLRERGLHAAARIASATGCKLLCDTFPARLERGAGIPEVERLPYFPEQAIQALSGYATLILAGTVEPVAFFGYPGMPSRLTPKTCTLDVLTRPHEDTVSALEALAEMMVKHLERAFSEPGPHLIEAVL